MSLRNIKYNHWEKYNIKLCFCGSFLSMRVAQHEHWCQSVAMTALDYQLKIPES